MAHHVTCKKCERDLLHYAAGKCEKCWRVDYNRRWIRAKRKRLKELTPIEALANPDGMCPDGEYDGGEDEPAPRS